jgi:FtsP/CotA-like multicopper oxidase with cupredoxin domain
VATSTNNQGRSTFGTFASFTSVAAFLIAVIAIIVVNDNTTSVTSTKTEPVAVSMSEFKFTPSTITVPVGGSLQITNDGTMAHNLAIEGGPETTDVNPGVSRSLDLSSLPAGTYAFSCTIPGHADSGMRGALIISTSGAAGETSTATDHSAHSETTDWAAMDQAMKDGADDYVKAVVASIEAGNPSGVATQGRGNQKLVPTILPDGTKQFALDASIIDWEVEPGRTVQAWAYNGQVPSPWIRVEPNDHVRVVLTNNLPAGTDIHFHGITTPFTQDGLAPITQPMVMPGETYTYEFYAPAEPELGMYHPHNHGQVAVVNGMFGVFQVGDVGLPRGQTINGVTVPANLEVAQELPMVLNDAGTIGLTLNGKAFPATDPVVSKVGDWTLVHYYNEGLQAHPMHLHHMPQLVVAKDGFPLEQPYFADTVNIAPGERYSVLVQSRAQDVNIDATDRTTVLGPGIWAYHCHILTHAEGDRGLQGMVTAWVVAP